MQTLADRLVEDCVFVSDSYCKAGEDLGPYRHEGERVSLAVGDDVAVFLDLGRLKKLVDLAATDPMRVRPDGVFVPAQWLVGVRVGY